MRECESLICADDGLEGLSELPPEQAVVKLQRQNARLRRKAEAVMGFEQENARLKSQLQDLATQMVCMTYLHSPSESAKAITRMSITYINCCYVLQATKVAAEMAADREAKRTANTESDPEKV